MSDDENARRFESLVMPHLDAAYNLARWLTRNDHDAQDVVQEALVRAMRYIGGFRGESGRAWLLQIVRNSCFSWLKANRPAELDAPRRRRFVARNHRARQRRTAIHRHAQG